MQSNIQKVNTLNLNTGKILLKFLTALGIIFGLAWVYKNLTKAQLQKQILQALESFQNNITKAYNNFRGINKPAVNNNQLQNNNNLVNQSQSSTNEQKIQSTGNDNSGQESPQKTITKQADLKAQSNDSIASIINNNESNAKQDNLNNTDTPSNNNVVEEIKPKGSSSPLLKAVNG